MSNSPAIITLLTDFGEDDSYVGAMKGVMLSILPDVRLVDISHCIAPQNIRQAALMLSNVYQYYPAYTVHLIVIDPGVGGDRRAIALETPQGRFVAPDNGVLSYVWQQEAEARAVILENQAYWRPSPSHTFHGRDIFSPVAAHLARGVPLGEFGEAVGEIALLPMPDLLISSGSIQGEVIHIDHFGNVLTNITELRWIDESRIALHPIGLVKGSVKPDEPILIDSKNARINCGWHTLNGLHHTYSDVPKGRFIALVGSSGELEIAMNQGSASENLAIKIGDPVTLRFSV